MNFLRRLWLKLTGQTPLFGGSNGTVFSRIVDAEQKAKNTAGKIIAAADSIKLKTQQAEKLMDDVKNLHIEHDKLDAIHKDIDKLLGE